MANVPIKQKRVRPQVTNIAKRQIAQPQAPVAGATQALASLGKAVGSAGEKLASHAIQRQKEEADREVVEGETEFRKSMQKVLHSTDTDENNIPIGLYNKTLGNAKRSTVKFDEEYEAIKKDYQDRFSESEYQQNNISALMDRYYSSTRNQVVTHENAEYRKDYENTFQANKTQSILDSSTMTESGELRFAIDEVMGKQSIASKAMGDSERVTVAKLGQIEHEMVENSVKNLISTDVVGAKRLLDELEDSLPVATYNDINKIVQGKYLHNKKVAMYHAVNNLNLADGSPDNEAREEVIMNEESLTVADKESIVSYVRARGRQAEADKKARLDADDNSFMKELTTYKDSGKDMDESLMLVAKYTDEDDPYEQKLKRDAVLKMYTEKAIVSDPAIYMELWEKAENGSTNKETIDEAFNRNLISTTDWRALRKTLFNPKSLSADTKLVMDNIELKAIETYGTKHNSKKKNELMYVVNRYASEGMKGDELYKKAIDLMKEVDIEKGWFNDIEGGAYELKLKKIRAESIAFGNLYETIGENATFGMIKGLNRNREDKLKYDNSQDVIMGLSEFVGKLNELNVDVDESNEVSIVGGLEILNSGTPVNNAIMSLQRKGKLVTPGNVKEVLSVHKDGIWK